MPGAATEGVNSISLASSSQRSKFRKPLVLLAALLRCSLLLFPQIFCFAKFLREPYIRGRCPEGAEGVASF